MERRDSEPIGLHANQRNGNEILNATLFVNFIGLKQPLRMLQLSYGIADGWLQIENGHRLAQVSVWLVCGVPKGTCKVSLCQKRSP